MADIEPRITVQQAADEIGVDAANPRLPRLIAVYDAFITRQISGAVVPDVIAAEAVMRMVAYAFDAQVAPGSTWANVYQNSGARRLLRDYIPARESGDDDSSPAQTGALPSPVGGPGVDQVARDAAAQAAQAAAVNTGFLSTFTARVTAVIESVVPAWARRAQPPAGTGGGTELPAFEQATTQGLFSRAGNLFWQVVREVPIAGAVGHVLTKTGPNDTDYRFQVLPATVDAVARAAANAAAGAARVNTQFLSTFAARVQVVIEAVVPAWARMAQPPAGGGVDQTARDAAATALRLAQAGGPLNADAYVTVYDPTFKTPLSADAGIENFLVVDGVPRGDKATIGTGLARGDRDFNPATDAGPGAYFLDELVEIPANDTNAVVVRHRSALPPTLFSVTSNLNAVTIELSILEPIAVGGGFVYYYLGTFQGTARGQQLRVRQRVEFAHTRYAGELTARGVGGILLGYDLPRYEVEPAVFNVAALEHSYTVKLLGLHPDMIPGEYTHLRGLWQGTGVGPFAIVNGGVDQEVTHTFTVQQVDNIIRNSPAGSKLRFQLWLTNAANSIRLDLPDLLVPVVAPGAAKKAQIFRPRRFANVSDHDLKNAALAAALASNGGETITIVLGGTSVITTCEWFNGGARDSNNNALSFKEQHFQVPGNATWVIKVFYMEDENGVPFLRLQLHVNNVATQSNLIPTVFF